MKYSVPFQFKSGSGTGDDGQKVFRAIASTDALDRDREVLLPKGVITEAFMKNPVMLRIHDYRHIPVGKVVNINVDEKQIGFDFVFTDNDEGKQLQDMYEKGFMSAFSVGFYPQKWTDIDENTPKQLDLPVANDETQRFDLTKYTLTPRRVIHQWELLEISPVPVPSNPEALLLRMKEDVVRKYYDAGHSKGQVDLLKDQIEGRFGDLLAQVEQFTKSLTDVDVNAAVSPHSTPVTEGNWSGDDARSSLARWASEDGSGDKDKINWGKYSRGFAWVNSEKAENFTSYKLPHHVVADGDLVAVWRGVTTAMAALLGARGGVELEGESGQAVYAHLARHYRDAKKDPPEFGKEYTEEELKAIEDEQLEVKVEDPAPSTDSDDGQETVPAVSDSELKTVVEPLLDALKYAVISEIKEMGETLRVKSNILIDVIESLKTQVEAISGASHARQAPPQNEANMREVDEEALVQVTEELSNLSKLLDGIR